MKKFLTTFSIVAALVALSSCNKEIEKTAPETTDSVRTVHFTAGPVTKTVFGEISGNSIPTLWTENHSVAISLNYSSRQESTTPVVSPDRKSANFSAKLTDDKSGNYTFLAVSPHEAAINFNNNYQSATLTIPTEQTPLEGSVDEAAQIIVAKKNVGGEFPASPVSVNFVFDHFTAYGKISFSNLSLAPGESITSVSLTAAENWAGRYFCYFGEKAAEENSASKTIMLRTDKKENIWFACAPVDLGGKTIEIEILTDKATLYKKTITVPSGKKFESGYVSSFTVDMKDVTSSSSDIYTLVEDIADLTLGSEILIVSGDKAMSTTQNSNNRPATGIIESDKTIAGPGSDVQVLTIENGTKKGTYAFNTGGGYLYAVAGENYLRTSNDLTDTGSWSISIEDSGIAMIKPIGITENRLLKYNPNNGNPIFSCYTTSQNDVSIYKKNGSGSGAVEAKEIESITVKDATLNYAVGTSFTFDGKVIAIYSDTSTEELDSDDYEVDDSAVNMESAGSYKVTVTYKADNKISTSFEISVTSGPISQSVEFSTEEYTGQGISGSGSQVSVSKAGITVASEKAYGAGTEVRVYANGSITISADGKSITKVELTSTASGTANNGPSKLQCSDGEYTYSGNVGTWTGSASSVTLKATAQFRFTKIVVTYTE